MPRALLSVSDKTGIADLGRGLAARGFELVSTGGTARVLAGAGLAVTGVSALTGFPEMMDGRVKTLHPALHGGILARRDHPADLAALDAHGLGLVDVVVVNLYPFVKAASNPDTPFDALVEEIDIGGPSLVRAAAKNFRDVLVVVDPADYTRLLAAVDPANPASGGRHSPAALAFRFELMKKAFAHTAAYDAAIAETLERVALNGEGLFERPRRGDAVLADRLELSLEKVNDLRYGENPHQAASWYRIGPPAGSGAVGIGSASVLQGKELSYTNLLDLDAAARIVLEFEEPAAAVVKHTNPCGVATGASAVDAYIRARDADSLAAFGGIVALNRPLDVAAAEAVAQTFIEAVVAPGVADDARTILARKPNMRVLIAELDPSREPGMDIRSVLGAVLVQAPDRVLEARRPWPDRDVDSPRVVTRRAPTPAEWEALRFAWRVCAHVKSNTVIFTDARRTLAIGAGQMSRVDAVNVAVMKAAAADRPLSGSAAASDGFFPFRDGLLAVARAGATAVVQPGGSVRDAEVIAAADEHDLAMVFTGRRHFRH
jgi:phosphoribosylaminoimidazolecarboxamide formyltransferase/IMP cyclohydrolase